MDDIERELKLIQLQRERLALERELAVRGVGNSAMHAAEAIAGGVTAPFRALGSAFGRWWKAMLGVLLLLGGIAATLGWKEYQDHEAHRALKQRWTIAKDAFVAEQCPEQKYFCRHSAEIDPYTCMLKDSQRKICDLDAWSEYQRRSPTPKFTLRRAWVGPDGDL